MVKPAATLWHDDERFVKSYVSAFEGCYLTGDGGRVDEDGYVFVMTPRCRRPAGVELPGRGRRSYASVRGDGFGSFVRDWFAGQRGRGA